MTISREKVPIKQTHGSDQCGQSHRSGLWIVLVPCLPPLGDELKWDSRSGPHSATDVRLPPSTSLLSLLYFTASAVSQTSLYWHPSDVLGANELQAAIKYIYIKNQNNLKLFSFKKKKKRKKLLKIFLGTSTHLQA